MEASWEASEHFVLGHPAQGLILFINPVLTVVVPWETESAGDHSCMGLSGQPELLLFLRGESGGRNNIEAMPGEVMV